MKLTVVFVDVSPLNYNENPTYRSEQIELTKEQENKLLPKNCGYTGCPEGRRLLFEEISRCFIEPDSIPIECKTHIAKKDESSPIF